LAANPNAYQSTVQEALARFRSKQAAKADPHSKRSDVVVTFVPVYQALKSAPLQFSLQGEAWPLQTNAYTLLVTLGETQAKGSVTFTSASPDVSPVVTHEALTDEDWELAQEAVEFAMKLGSSSNLGGKFMNNGAGRRDAFSAIYDGRGSCRMGKDAKDSVVDHELRVHGVKGLRIVDGSVIPQASPYLALPEVLALAERAADLMVGEEGSAHAASEVKQTTSPYSVGVLKQRVGEHASLMEMVAYQATGLTESMELMEVRGAEPHSAAILLLLPLAFAVVTAVFAMASKSRAAGSEGLSYEPLIA